MKSNRGQCFKRAAIGYTLLAVMAFGSSAFAAGTPDAWITTKIKLALLTTPGVHSTNVNVDTIDGRVTLHGTVASEQEKTLAVQSARGVDGVKDLRDMLAVVVPAKQEAVATADAQIGEQVEDALKADEALADSSIKVASVNDGVVLLSGTAATLSDHLAAIEDAYEVKGVLQVASEIESPDKLSDAEIWRDTTESANAGAQTTIGTMSDMWITTAAKVRLMANRETPATEINVDTTNGVVTLFGMVPTEESKRAAEAEVGKVSGVQAVTNALKVVAEPAQAAVKANDAEIKDRIAKRVEDAEMNGADIGVAVTDGAAHLTGHVHGQTDHLRALTIVSATSGVSSVVGELEVNAVD